MGLLLNLMLLLLIILMGVFGISHICSTCTSRVYIDFVHQQVPISINTHAVDTLIWMPSSSGVLTAKEAYKFLRPSLPSLDWSKVIWCKHVAPRMSLLVWKVLRGRVISEDFLQK